MDFLVNTDKWYFKNGKIWAQKVLPTKAANFLENSDIWQYLPQSGNSAKNLVLLALAATPNFFQPGSARLAARGPAM